MTSGEAVEVVKQGSKGGGGEGGGCKGRVIEALQGALDGFQTSVAAPQAFVLLLMGILKRFQRSPLSRSCSQSSDRLGGLRDPRGGFRDY